MAMMNAAVVTSSGEPPRYRQSGVPQPDAADEFIVGVLAAGLHPRVRSGAAAAHYTSSGTLPVIPGIDPGRLGALTSAGADDVVQLAGDGDATARALAAAAAESDIVLDYLRGTPAQHAITALLTARSDRSREMNRIQIGAVAGPTVELPPAALRSANFRLQGSGQGSVPAQAYLAELPSLAAGITAGTIAVTAAMMPLADVEQIWPRAEVPGERTVLVP